MVFYFKARPEAGDYTIFMGLDKHENEELIRYGFPEDICVAWIQVVETRLDLIPRIIKIPYGNRVVTVAIFISPVAVLSKSGEPSSFWPISLGKAVNRNFKFQIPAGEPIKVVNHLPSIPLSRSPRKAEGAGAQLSQPSVRVVDGDCSSIRGLCSGSCEKKGQGQHGWGKEGKQGKFGFQGSVVFFGGVLRDQASRGFSVVPVSTPSVGFKGLTRFVVSLGSVAKGMSGEELCSSPNFIKEVSNSPGRAMTFDLWEGPISGFARSEHHSIGSSLRRIQDCYVEESPGLEGESVVSDVPNLASRVDMSIISPVEAWSANVGPVSVGLRFNQVSPVGSLYSDGEAALRTSGNAGSTRDASVLTFDHLGVPSQATTSWFHVDKMSSAHVYVRLNKGQTIDDISEGLLEDCAQLVKANSIQGKFHAGGTSLQKLYKGNKVNNIDVVYTPWYNLKKTPSMDVGQVGFHNPKMVRTVRVEKRINDIVNRLNKTKVERKPDLKAERESVNAAERAERKLQLRDKKRREEMERLEKEKQAEMRSYKGLMVSDKMTSNKQIASANKSLQELEEDFM
ncbi:hypothetical protein HHK36_032687 [Tetracentron sinense]|uniref:NFACT RNA-binding domain-containing protein n=1 Tax=Tetracentron sinense TaxID=13715 RepID=A0A834Y7H0_TETSI|nr:hypothetical protein HHK36_032687 [Tetracentron sinense]